MGTKTAPSHANNYMGHFEKDHVYTYHTQPLIWLRFIDDIFAIWTGDETSLLHFIDHLNHCEETIKFTAEYSPNKVNFLDTTIYLRKEGYLETDLYSKPTDSHNYLLYSSAHPEHCKKSLPYSQFLRIRRICSSVENFEKHSDTLSNHFERRGYPLKLIQDARDKARQKERHTLLSNDCNKRGDTDDSLYIIQTYQPDWGGLRDVVSKNWDFLTRSNDTKFLHEKKLIYAYRRNQNLKDLLVNAKITYPPKPKSSDQAVAHDNPCKTSKCRYCPKINKGGRITSTTTQRTYQSKSRVDCKSGNLIYCITCKTCKLQYVGQTKRRLMDRFQGHFYNVNSKNLKDTVGKHFNLTNHGGIDDIEIHIIDFIHAHPSSVNASHIRRKIEKNWQQRLKTNAPQGLNIQE